jgi:ubiquinone/menaquinone biosynthesis C-methylase UbiE
MCTDGAHYPAARVDLTAQRRDWEDLGRLDPLWAVLSDPGKRFGGWEPEEFFASGERDVEDFLETCGRHGLPVERSHALDFGCGAGRLTRALSTRFDRTTGIDISEPMINLARRLNQDRLGCEFLVNASDDLSRFDDESFDFVVSHIVLQHVPRREAILGYVGELARVLRSGGALVFQVPSSIPMRYRLQLQRRMYGALRAAGVRVETLYRRLRLQPMRMTAVSVEAVTRRLEERGLRVIELDTSQEPGGVVSTGYVATR